MNPANACEKKSLFAYSKKIISTLAFTVLIVSSAAFAKDIPGSTETSYGVSANGAFQFQIPILIPQGRNGVQPNLSLSFSSASGNGMAGIGWNVSGLGVITRCGKTIATNGIAGGVLHDQNDRFCLNGQQLILVSGTYGAAQSEYRTELEQFSRIVAVGDFSVNVNGGRAPSYWKVWRKDGRIESYGQGPAATQKFRLPGTNSIHTWPLTSVADRSGNEYKVFYRGNQEGYPTNIKYSYGNGLAAEQEVLYHYEARPDVRSRYIVGRKITIADRLKRIEVKNKGVTVREYRLDYAANDATFNGVGVEGESRLASVTECGMSNECMPPINVEWKAQTPGYALTSGAGNKSPDDLIEYYTFTRHLGGGNNEPNSVKQIDRGQWVDINGDGETDMVLSAILPNGNILSKAYIKSNGAWQEQPQWRLPLPLRNYDNVITNGTTGRFSSDVINQGQLSDVNGDGLVDVVYSYQLRTDNHQSGPITTFQKTYLNTGSGWQESTAYAPVEILFDYTSNGAGLRIVPTVRGQLLDINGDGLSDWVTAYYDYTSNGNGVEYKRTWLNNGNGWTRTTAYDMPDVFTQYRGVYSLNHGQFVDVNGDGLLDWVQAYQASLESPTKNTWLNTGSGWQKDNSYNLPDIIYSNINGWNNNAPLTRGRFIDLNGDGLQDWVRSYETVGGVTGTAAFLNTGKGWVVNTGYKPPFVYWSHRYSDFERGWPLNIRGIHIDLNRDGLIDYVESYKSSSTGFPVSKKAWLNTGSGWQQQSSNSPYAPAELYFDYSGRDNAKSQFGQWLDINSDGTTDWVRSRVGLANTAHLAQTGKVNQLASVTTTLGVVVKPTFLPLTANDSIYIKTPTDVATNQLLEAENDSLLIEAPVYVVSTLETSRPDAPANFNSMEYRYAGLQVHRAGRGGQGFYQRTVIDTQKSIITTNEFHQAFPLTGRSKSARTKVGGVTLSETDNVYAFTTSNQVAGGKTYFPYMQSSISSEAELNGGSTTRVTQRTLEYDSYGNIDLDTTQVNAKESSGVLSLLRQTIVDPEYIAPNLTDWLVGLVRDISTTASAPNQSTIVNKTAFTYDALGRPSTEIQEPDSSDVRIKLITTLTYDASGNIAEQKIESTDQSLLPRIESFEYDANRRLPITQTNSEGHITQLTHHAQCDLPSSTIDLNGLITTVDYDGFCREIKATNPIGIEVTTSYEHGSFACTDCQVTPVFKSTVQSSNSEAPVTTFANAYLQTLLSSTIGMGDEIIEQLTEYDRFGRESHVSQPYFIGDTRQWTSYNYDILDRVISTVLPFINSNGLQATASQTYSVDLNGRLEQSNTDTEGRTTKKYANALGQIVEIKDAHQQSLHYEFDPHGNLIKTTDALNNSIMVAYDVLDRRTSLDDPDLGLTAYEYDAFGDLLSQTDAKNQTLSMSYDRLGRMIERTIPGTHSAGTSIWVYDTATNGKGQLASVSGADANIYSKTYEYDQYSRPVSENTTIRGDVFEQSMTYDANGFLASRRYPDSGTGQIFEVHYNYRNGYLSSITDRQNGLAGCIEHWRADKYDALGRTQQETLGRIVTTNRTFDSAQGTITKIKAVLAQGDQSTVQELDYSYDGMNNLLTRSNTLSGTSESFEYDALDRLTKHTKAAQVTDVQYDAIGNITYKSDVGTYSYTGSGGPHAVSRVELPVGGLPDLTQFSVDWGFDGQQQLQFPPNMHGENFVYDAVGNIKQYGDRWVWWTAFNKPYRMERVNAGQEVIAGSDIEYGPNLRRVVKEEYKVRDSGNTIETTVYIGKEYERITDNSGGIKHRYIIVAGDNTIQIERENDSVFDQPKYLLGDNQGSTNVILNALAQVEQRLEFDPWGMRVKVDNTSVNSITNKGYTGHEMDDEVGLTNMNARIYDPYLGRFLSADPVLPDEMDMQAYNRYAYVLNNPLKYTDPTGHVSDPVSAFIINSAIASSLNFIFGFGSDRPVGPPVNGLYGLDGFGGLINIDLETLSGFIGTLDPQILADALVQQEIYNADRAREENGEAPPPPDIDITIGSKVIKTGSGSGCDEQICFTGPGSRNPVVLLRYQQTLVRYAATQEGARLISGYFSGVGSEDFRWNINLVRLGRNGSEGSTGLSRINLSDFDLDGSPIRVFQGKNSPAVGSEFRTFSHEAYHALSQFRSDIEPLAINSANRAVMQNAILLGRPETAGVRLSHDEGAFIAALRAVNPDIVILD